MMSSNGDPTGQVPLSSNGSNLPATSSAEQYGMRLPPGGMPMWPGPPAGGEGVNVFAFLHALRRRWMTAVGVGIMVAGLVATLMWILIPVKFTAESLLRVRRNPESVIGKDRGQTDREFETYKQTNMGLMRSPLVISAALRNLDVSQLKMLKDENNKIEFLQDELRVGFVNDSEILRVALAGEDEDEIEQIIEAVIQAFLDEVVFKERQERIARRDILRESYRENRRKIKDEMDKLIRLQEEVGSTDAESVRMKIEFALAQLKSMRDRRDAIAERLDEVETQIYLLQTALNDNDFRPSEYLIEDECMKDPMYRELAMAVDMLEQQRQLAASSGGRNAGGFGQDQSQLIALKNQLQRLRKELVPRVVERLRLEAGQNPAELRQKLDMLAMEQRLLHGRLQKANKSYEANVEEVQKMGVRSADLLSRADEIDGLKDVTFRIQQEMDSLNLNLQRPARVQVIQPPVVPNPGNIKFKLLIVISASVVTWGLVVLGVAAWDYQGKRLNTTDEIVNNASVRVLGGVPSLNGGGMLRLGGRNSHRLAQALEASIDSVRTSLMYNGSDEPVKAVLVTSATAQEGKTTLASQLAISFAKAGRRTLLIDGDVRNPQQHLVFGMPPDRGLCEVLRKETKPEAVIKATPQEMLWLLPAGFGDREAAQALAGNTLRELMHRLRDQFHAIIIDSGPVLTGPEAMLLGQHADVAVLAARRDQSRLPKVSDACDRLRSVGVRIFGSVVNGVGTEVRARENGVVARRKIEASPEQAPQEVSGAK